MLIHKYKNINTCNDKHCANETDRLTLIHQFKTILPKPERTSNHYNEFFFNLL